MSDRAARVPLVAGNWKMNTTVPEGIELAGAIVALPRPAGVEVALLPPFTHLWPIRDVLRGSGVALGAQDCFWEAAGAWTGEVSPRTLAGCCELVLVGHSERRRLLGERDDEVGRKLRCALAEGLLVIVAVGETLAEREAGEAQAVVRRQLDAALDNVDPTGLARCAVAYEPVWAIGTGRTASPVDAQAMCAAIRQHVAALASPDVAGGLRILYGGSVTAGTAAALFAERDIDGGLIGGASLVAEEFGGIVRAAADTPAVPAPGGG